MPPTFNWKKLQTPTGSAAKIPEWLEVIGGSDGQRRKVERAYQNLDEALVGANVWASAAAPTIDCALSKLSTASYPEYLLWLTASILAADCYSVWLERRHNDPKRSPELKACVDAVARNRHIIAGCLASPHPNQRAAAASVLGATTGSVDWARAVLEEHLPIETAGLVRATTLCALDLLDNTGHWQATLAKIAHDGDPDPLVWGVAALSWLRDDALHNPEEVTRGIEAWLSSTLEPYSRLQFANLLSSSQYPKSLASVLKRQGEEARSNALSAMIAIGKTTATHEAVRGVGYTLDILLGRPEPGSPDSVIPTNELSCELRAIAEGLADSSVYPEARWMPAAGGCRRRWLGLEPPSVLEEPAPPKVDSRKPARMLWEVLQELDKDRDSEDLLPPAVTEALNPEQQWRAAVEFHEHVYGVMNLVEWSTLTTAVEHLRVDEKLETTIHSLCRDALIRQRLVAGLGTGNAVVSRLLLLPLVRNKRPIPEEFWELLWLKDEPEEREIMATIPRAYLARVIVERLESSSPKSIFSSASRYLPLVEMVPEPTVCDALIRAKKLMDDDSVKEYQEMLEETARKVPALHAALEGSRG